VRVPFNLKTELLKQVRELVPHAGQRLATFLVMTEDGVRSWQTAALDPHSTAKKESPLNPVLESKPLYSQEPTRRQISTPMACSRNGGPTQEQSVDQDQRKVLTSESVFQMQPSPL